MILSGIMLVTFDKVIRKFGKDETNISNRNVLLKNMLSPGMFTGQERHVKL